MSCENCPYSWKENGEDFPCCHYESAGDFDLAPCEVSEYETWIDEEQ